MMTKQMGLITHWSFDTIENKNNLNYVRKGEPKI